MTQNGWQSRLTWVVAAQVRYYRKLRGLSTQQLADRCEALGFEIPRAVLSNLETGRRESVSVAEVLVLAHALGVSPPLLIAPVGRQDSVEVLPDRVISPFDAVRWLAGEVYLEERSDGIHPRMTDAEDDTLYLFQRHRWLLMDWRNAAQALSSTPEGLMVPADEDQIAGRRRNVGREIRKLRAQMRELGLNPPPLPIELAPLDAAAAGRDASGISAARRLASAAEPDIEIDPK